MFDASMRFPIHITIGVLSLFLFLTGLEVDAQVQTDTLTPQEAAALQKKLDRELKKSQRKTSFQILPIVYYTPETDLAFGATAIYMFKMHQKDSLLPFSQIQPSFIYTLNKQVLGTVHYQLYPNRNWVFMGKVGYLVYPYFFSGIGNTHDLSYKEWYDATYPVLKINAYRKISPKGLSAGLRYRYQNTQITSSPDSLLGHGNVPGERGSVQSALGFGFKYNTTDFTGSPTKGWYVNAYTMWNSTSWGGDYNDQILLLDARKYLTISKKKDVLALQVFAQSHTGDVPFNLMSMLGGRYRMRGYQEGIYRDRQMHVYQLEYRSRLFFKYFGFVLFGNYGGIGNDFDEVTSNYRYTLGTGLRFTPLPEKRYFVRLDYAIGDGTQGFYIEIGEAF